jgi:regulator of cell morphogenesis and NO signaling
MTNIAEQTMAVIVSENYQTAPILEKYNLDFYCKGKRTLAQACCEKGVSTDTVLKELENILQDDIKASNSFNSMTAHQLIGRILLRHHFYVKQIMPVIDEHLKKIILKHSGKYPYMTKVLVLFTQLKNDMYLHLQKGEMILFPV